MPKLTTEQMVVTADRLANELISYAASQGISVRDLLVTVAFSERLLQSSLCGDNHMEALEAVFEADATYRAVSSVLESN